MKIWRLEVATFDFLIGAHTLHEAIEKAFDEYIEGFHNVPAPMDRAQFHEAATEVQFVGEITNGIAACDCFFCDPRATSRGTVGRYRLLVDLEADTSDRLVDALRDLTDDIREHVIVIDTGPATRISGHHRLSHDYTLLQPPTGETL